MFVCFLLLLFFSGGNIGIASVLHSIRVFGLKPHVIYHPQGAINCNVGVAKKAKTNQFKKDGIIWYKIEDEVEERMGDTKLPTFDSPSPDVIKQLPTNELILFGFPRKLSWFCHWFKYSNNKKTMVRGPMVINAFVDEKTLKQIGCHEARLVGVTQLFTVKGQSGQNGISPHDPKAHILATLVGFANIEQIWQDEKETEKNDKNKNSTENENNKKNQKNKENSKESDSTNASKRMFSVDTYILRHHPDIWKVFNDENDDREQFEDAMVNRFEDVRGKISYDWANNYYASNVGLCKMSAYDKSISTQTRRALVSLAVVAVAAAAAGVGYHFDVKDTVLSIRKKFRTENKAPK